MNLNSAIINGDPTLPRFFRKKVWRQTAVEESDAEVSAMAGQSGTPAAPPKRTSRSSASGRHASVDICMGEIGKKRPFVALKVLPSE